jgi:hypothetical protein
LPFDHPLSIGDVYENWSQKGADAYRYLLSYGAIWGVALDLVAFNGAVVLQIEHDVSASVLDSVNTIGGERHCMRYELLVR